ncbi:MAG: dockerin type I repeat-containing protein, partial [Muribaculaceae bacterium]|nr:dockerin type I repeat-containing protein [Muribaculaceae bacterium]
NFVAYYMDAPDADGNQVCIAELTADNDIANATKYWTLHSEGVGTSCTGHNLSIKKITDTKGNESVYLFSFCKNNGYALYQISQETFNKPNTFAVEDFRIKRDSTFTMPVAMLNDSTITAFQCDIVLPQGITVTKTDDVIDVTLADKRKQDHTINAELLDDGTLRVISSSLTLAQYTGNSGNLFSLGLAVDENGVDGKHTIEIKNIKLSSVTGSQCNAPATKATAEIYTFEQGDANGDHKIDVADVVSITQVILGKTEEAVNETVPDYNNDKVVDVFDIVEIIKYILSQQSTESQAVTMSAFETAKDAVSIESFTVDRFGTGTIDIALRNITPFTAFQMDLRLPKGLTVTAQRMSSRASSSHALLAQANGENSVRLLSYSSMADTYGDNSGVLLSIDVKADETFEGNGMATINNITFADTQAQSYSLKNVAAQINMPTAINDVYATTHVYAAGKVIVIESPTDAVATVSSVSGIAENIEIKAGKNICEANAQGTYIVSINGKNYKVILK